MRVGILGSGVVAKALGVGFINEGHQVQLGSRAPHSLASWVGEHGSRASLGTLPETAAFGELIVLSVFGLVAKEAIDLAGVANFTGKIVIDATNPLDKSGGMPPRLVGGFGTSGGELNQQALPGAFVVKAFNTMGAAVMYKPQFKGGPPDMFLCGDDTKAKEQVARICADFGWNPIDVGEMKYAHYIEATSMLWTITARSGGFWNQAFKLLRD